jgi:hypothetical protein
VDRRANQELLHRGVSVSISSSNQVTTQFVPLAGRFGMNAF